MICRRKYLSSFLACCFSPSRAGVPIFSPNHRLTRQAARGKARGMQTRHTPGVGGIPVGCKSQTCSEPQTLLDLAVAAGLKLSDLLSPFGSPPLYRCRQNRQRLFSVGSPVH